MIKETIEALIDYLNEFLLANPEARECIIKPTVIGYKAGYTSINAVYGVDKHLALTYDWIKLVKGTGLIIDIERFKEFNKQLQEKAEQEQQTQRQVEVDKEAMPDYENAEFKAEWKWGLYPDDKTDYPIMVEVILKKMKSYSPIIAVFGEPQSGKSTFAWLLANWLSLEANKEYWNWKKYCVRSVNEFVQMVDKYNNKVIVVEEASFQLSSRDWQTTTDKIFGKLIDTQGYKHNCYILTLPYALGTSTTVRRSLTYYFVIIKKGTVGFNVVKHSYTNLENADSYHTFINRTGFGYFMEENKLFKYSNQYTDWIKEFKMSIMKELKEDMEKYEMKKKKK